MAELKRRRLYLWYHFRLGEDVNIVAFKEAILDLEAVRQIVPFHVYVITGGRIEVGISFSGAANASVSQFSVVVGGVTYFVMSCKCVDL